MEYSFLNIKSLVLFISFVINVFLGSFVLSRNVKNDLNRSFAAVTVFVAVWILGDYFANVSANVDSALFWSKTVFIGAAFIPGTFLYFTFVFLKKVQYSAFTRSVFFFLPAVVFLLISPTDLMVSDVQLMSWGVKYVYGPLYSLFIVYFLSYVTYAFYNLAVEYRSAHGLKKARIGYMFLGAAISGSIWMATTLVLPSLFGIKELYRLGPFSFVVMTSFVAYSITTHRLRNIAAVIQKGLAYSAMIMVVMGIYFSAIVALERLSIGVPAYGSLLVMFIASVVVTIAYQPLLGALQKIFDKLFFKAGYDYEKTLRDVSRALASVMRLRQLGRYIMETLWDAIKVEE
ncbi:histidine kinase N-terminal 7TM domain-containing protein, partial [Candidatus Margulisiibacteriota bacterium]